MGIVSYRMLDQKKPRLTFQTFFPLSITMSWNERVTVKLRCTLLWKRKKNPIHYFISISRLNHVSGSCDTGVKLTKGSVITSSLATILLREVTIHSMTRWLKTSSSSLLSSSRGQHRQSKIIVKYREVKNDILLSNYLRKKMGDTSEVNNSSASHLMWLPCSRESQTGERKCVKPICKLLPSQALEKVCKRLSSDTWQKVTKEFWNLLHQVGNPVISIPDNNDKDPIKDI